MKRKQDDHVHTPNSKRHQFVLAGGDAVEVEDALSYFKLVREVYKDDVKVCDRFYELLIAAANQRVDTSKLAAKVKILFKDNDFLFLGFVAFLPKQHRRPVEVEEAIDCARKIKATFGHNEHLYGEFLKILRAYSTGKKSSMEATEEASLLLVNYPLLLEKFMRFHPQINGAGFVKASLNTTSQVGKVQTGEREEDFVDRSISKEEDDLKVVLCGPAKHDLSYGTDKHMSKRNPDGLEHALVLEKPIDLQLQSCKGSKTVAQHTVPRPPTQRVLRKEIDFLTLLQGKLSKKEDHQKLCDYLYSYSDGRIARKDLVVLVTDMIQDHPELIDGFNRFMSQYETTELEFLSAIQQGLLNEKVKKRHAEQQICFRERKGKGDNDHLKSVRETHEKQDKNQWAKNADVGGKTQQEKESMKHAFSVSKTIEKQDTIQWEKKAELERKREEELANTKHASCVKETNGKKVNDLWTKKMELERKTQQEKEYTKHASRDVLNQKSSPLMNGNGCFDKPFLDLAPRPQLCTPSYCKSMKNWSPPEVGSRACVDHAVLNDTWVSIRVGKEAKPKLKNQYEENLFQLEEDRYELDMLLATFGSAIRSLEESLEKMDKAEGTDIINGLTASSVRCIEHLYGEHGLDVLDLLHENAAVSLPTILKRLKQKQDETLRYKAEMNKIWAEVSARNFHKSLDHRTLYFEEQDKKNLSTKGLVAEIKEANTMKRNSDDFIISSAYGESRPFIPDLRLESLDSGIRSDLYEILTHSVQELFPDVDESDKIMHVWEVFLVPLCHGCKENIDKACARKVSEKDQTKSLGNVSDSCTDDQGAKYEDTEQRMIINDPVARETAAAFGTNLVIEDRPLCPCLCPRSTPTNICDRNRTIFYGNDNMYVLLRLYQALHERIHNAKVDAAATERKLKEAGGDYLYEPYARFLHALYGFLDGTTDITEFEDVCRFVSGNKFFLFLTMDKLIYKLVKQLRVVASDETAIELLALHDYEQSRFPSSPVDAAYHANASMLLDDENVYRFEQRLEDGQLFVQLMEGPLDRGSTLPINALLSTCAKDLSKFLLLEPVERPQRDRLFLKRYKHSCPEEEAQMGALKDVFIMNGLEINMSCINYKIKYAVNTKDLFYRKKRNSRMSTHARPPHHICKSTIKFQRWLNLQIQTDTCLGR